MAFKVNISDKGKTYKLELESEGLMGKSLGDVIQGKEIKPELEGYELEITGGSDKSGFPMYKGLEGTSLKGVLLTKGWGMKDPRKGLRLRKKVRGRDISEFIVQINFIVKKEGSKKLEDVFVSAAEGAEGAKEEAKPEEKIEEKKEEVTTSPGSKSPGEEKKEEGKKERD